MGDRFVLKTKTALKGAAKRLAEDVFGLTISSIRAHGRQDWADIRSAGCRIETIFDIGANIGQSALKFTRAFPQAQIHSFEPVELAYHQLEHAVRKNPRIHCHRLALGSSEGEGTIYLTAHSTTSSLIKPDDARSAERVIIDTIDKVALRNGIDRIDLLKVDAEGFDLEVLKGASDLLSHNSVALVLIEVGFHPGDQRHVLLDDARAFLMDRGFSLFGIYDQALEWSGEKRLRFANACFSNEQAFR